MGKRTQCCIKVSRSSCSSSSSSSSEDLCPTVIGGQLTTSYSAAASTPFTTIAQGALKAVTQPFAISGVAPPANQNAYVTPLACNGGTAQGIITWGVLYLVAVNPSGSTYPYTVLKTVAIENTGVVSTSESPATFQVKLKRKQALVFLPYLPSNDEPAFGSTNFVYNFYPKCSSVPCLDGAPQPYM